MRSHYFNSLLDISKKSTFLTGNYDEVLVNYTSMTPSANNNSVKHDFTSNITYESIKNDMFLGALILNIQSLLSQLKEVIELDKLKAIYVSDLINVYILACIDLGLMHKKEIVVVSHSGGPLLFRRYSRFCSALAKLYIELPVRFEAKFNYIVPVEMDPSFNNVLSEDCPISNLIKDNRLVTESSEVISDQFATRKIPDTVIIACEFYLGSFYTEDYLVLLVQDILQTVRWCFSNGLSVIIRFRGTHQLVIPDLLSGILKISISKANSMIKNKNLLQIKIPGESLTFTIGWNSKHSTKSCLYDLKFSPILLVIGRSSSVMLEGHIARVPVLYLCRDHSSYFIEEHRVCYHNFLMNCSRIEDVYDKISQLCFLPRVDS